MSRYPGEPPPIDDPGGGSPPSQTRIDDYLDGLLSPQEREQFEAELARSPELRAQIELQKSIDGSLGRLFNRDEPVPLPASGEVVPTMRIAHPPEARQAPASGRRTVLYSFRIPLAAAALVTLSVLGLWLGGVLNGPGPTPPIVLRPKLIDPEQAYQTQLAVGFKPVWICKDDAEFRKYAMDTLGQELLAKPLEGVTLVGWTNTGANVLSPAGALLIAKVTQGGTTYDDIIVLDSTKKDRQLSLPESSGLHLFRRTVGELVLYEITKRSTSLLLDQFYVPAPEPK
jgi:hypothetical protein